MKIVSKSRLLRKEDSMDSLVRHDDNGEKRNMQVLYKAQRSWDSLYKLRSNRERLLKYTYGEQYLDKVSIDGVMMSKEEYWAQQGVIPKKNNLIRKMVRAVIGVYKKQDIDFTAIARDRAEQKVGEMMTITLQANREMNRIDELETRLFEEFVISSMVFIKESWGWRRNRKDTWTDIVSPNHVFFDGVMQDVRHWDCDMIGQIHDLPFQEVAAQFAQDPISYKRLAEIYKFSRDEYYMASHYDSIYGSYSQVRGSFYVPQDINLCRVIEVWNKEQKPRYRCHDILNGEYYKVEIDEYDYIANENQSRIEQGAEQGIPQEDVPLIEVEWFMDSYWYFRFLSPLGDVLQEGETPFKHGEHPYTMKIHPFIDGKPHSLVEDSIDQQDFVNELITLYMLMAKHSAKGLLMFPEQLMPEDLSIEDIAEQYAKVNGMIVYKHKDGVPMPQQLASNISNFNISELLKIEMSMFDNVTGVEGALQGKSPASGTAASLYDMQTQNATTTLVDVLSSFGNFLKEANIKKMSNIHQYYTDERVVSIAGTQYGGIKKYQPALAQDVEFDLSITEGLTSPEYKQVVNNFLLELWKAQGIGIDQLLEFGDFPKSDAILQSIKVKQEQAQDEVDNAQTQGAPLQN
ncbi:MAG: hypothetical protein WCR45_07955 [Bacteroidaceae bacterium]